MCIVAQTKNFLLRILFVNVPAPLSSGSKDGCILKIFFLTKLITFFLKINLLENEKIYLILFFFSISNPSNLSFVEVIIKKKIKYEDFYKVLISESVAKKLLLDLSFPYVEVTEVKLNKSFIAKKAITENVEKNIANKAPITKISIDNLSVREKIKKTKLKNYSILVAEFYNVKSAELLKEKLATILINSNYKLIYINKKNNNSYELLMGPYNTIKKLKNDYITLNDSNFEDLDIKIND